jgi:hypothetical protein
VSWSNAGLIEIGLVFGLVLAWAAYDLFTLKREMRADEAAAVRNAETRTDGETVDP